MLVTHLRNACVLNSLTRTISAAKAQVDSEWLHACMSPLYLQDNMDYYGYFAGIKAELEETKIKSIETSEKLKERNRQYQKLQVRNLQYLKLPYVSHF